MSFALRSSLELILQILETKTGAGKGMMPNDGKGNDSMFTALLGYNPLLYPDRTAKVSPISHVKEDCPPMLLQHGTNDLVIDYHQSSYMYEKLKAYVERMRRC